MRKLLEYHFEAGLKVKPGSVAVVLLLSHLLRIGHDDFWQELSAFSAWAATKNLTVLPGLPPYPTGLRHTDLMIIGQFMQHLVLEVKIPPMVSYCPLFSATPCSRI